MSWSTDLTGVDRPHTWNGDLDKRVSRLAARAWGQALCTMNGDKKGAGHLEVEGDRQISGDIQVSLKQTETGLMREDCISVCYYNFQIIYKDQKNKETATHMDTPPSPPSTISPSNYLTMPVESLNVIALTSILRSNQAVMTDSS